MSSGDRKKTTFGLIFKQVQHANAAGVRGVPAQIILNSPSLRKGLGDGWPKSIPKKSLSSL
jgi:hypothetical protein